jgi:RNA polymerase-binding transcription factor DksA
MRAEDAARQLDEALAELLRTRAGLEEGGMLHVPENEAVGELGARGNHPADLASEMYEREVESGLVEELSSEIDEVRAAQERLAQGVYGRCETCGEPIGDERLSAVPWARRCVRHQGAAERGLR